MRILYINKNFRLVGGVERYFFDLANLMKEKGHKVSFFSMTEDHNISSARNKYFLRPVSFDDKTVPGRIRYMSRIFYSPEARKKITLILKKFSPDIVHIHDIYHQISPSVLLEIAKRNIPMVQTLGNYHLISPNYNMYHDGAVCEITRRNKYYNAFFHRCVKNSYMASFIEVAEKYFHNAFGWEKNLISKFIVPSQFLRNKLMDYGIDPEKIITIPHFVTKTKGIKKRPGSYILYFGRLTEEKGLLFLINVMEKLPGIQLKITGRGPLREELEKMVRKNRIKNVIFTGFKQGRNLTDIISGSRFTILPSLWYEVFGLSILESFACNKTVLASKTGGIPEVVKDGYNGLLFDPGNMEECKGKILKLWRNAKLRERLEENALRDARMRFSEDKHYGIMIKLYQEVIKRQTY